jgi:hypothetical protein
MTISVIYVTKWRRSVTAAVKISSPCGRIKPQNTMKKTGLFIFGIGVIMALFSGFALITKEKVVDIGTVEITRNNKHRFDWSPLIGVGVMAFGAGVYLIGKRKYTSVHISK